MSTSVENAPRSLFGLSPDPRLTTALYEDKAGQNWQGGRKENFSQLISVRGAQLSQFLNFTSIWFFFFFFLQAAILDVLWKVWMDQRNKASWSKGFPLFTLNRILYERMAFSSTPALKRSIADNSSTYSKNWINSGRWGLSAGTSSWQSNRTEGIQLIHPTNQS